MRPFLLLALSILCIYKSYCQPALPAKIDSLQNDYARNKADSIYIDILVLKANTVMYTNYDLADKYADSAIHLALKNKLPKKRASAYRLKGVVLMNKGELSKALDYTYLSLQEAAAINNKLFTAGLYNNIGAIKLRLQEYDSAVYYFKRLQAIADEEKDSYQQGIALANLSSIYLNTDSLEQNIVTGEMALAISIPNKFSQISSYVLFNMGAGYVKRNEPDSALNYMERSLQYSIAANLADATVQAQLGLSNVYLMKKKYKDAISLGEKALMKAKQMNAFHFQEQVLPILSEAYDSLGNKARALFYYKDYIKVRDSILGIKKREEVIKKEAVFENEKKTAVLNATHAATLTRQKTIRNFFIAGLALVLLASGLMFLQYKRSRDAQARQKEAELQAQIAETETKVLRLQMNPHFIFNSLNSIGDYLLKNNTKAADEYLSKFAKLMRQVLENSEQKKVSLSDDLKALELYMQLESLRLNNHFAYHIDVEKNIDTDEVLIPPSLLQPLVENSIWHGIAPSGKEGIITIRIRQEGDGISYTVADNGVGLKENPGTADTSFGTKITRSRVQFIQKTQYSNAFIDWIPQSEGTLVKLLLPAV